MILPTSGSENVNILFDFVTPAGTLRYISTITAFIYVISLVMSSHIN